MTAPTQPTATSIYDALAITEKRALACPYWCSGTWDHGITDAEIDRVGELWRHHVSREVVAVESPTFGRKPVTVQLEQMVVRHGEDGVSAQPVTLPVHGLPDEGLTTNEAAALAHTLTLMARSAR
ncbi:hypothetical protein GCM10010472_11070 [Pseudonocardia halophobica]|uniref:Uncharacterized protein n=1 Tax=Pseudonocardia halophobica TaxID=29401 RepID=A0A9W6LA07_9PSEU|nr:hypothetical protein [Pseudonocardia halophobica]GLL13494.1 hypothetical protein GCM10017577_46380 [Pseudonocardia halophobica]